MTVRLESASWLRCDKSSKDDAASKPAQRGDKNDTKCKLQNEGRDWQ